MSRTSAPAPTSLRLRRLDLGAAASGDPDARRERDALIRRADDKGVFVMLDAATPTRLFAALPPGTEVQRMTLVEAIELTKSFLS